MDDSQGSSDMQAAEAVDILLAQGVNTIDTARIYPGSEETIGRLEKRTQLTIDTKIPGGFAPGTAHEDTVLEHAIEALHKARIEKFDVLYIHAPDAEIPLEDTLSGINKAHKAGVFTRFGLSNFTADDVQRVYDLAKAKGYPLPQIYQGNYNPVARHLEETLFPVLRKLNMVFYAYSPLAGGFLTKTPAELDAGAGRFNSNASWWMYSSMYNKPALRVALTIWNEIAEREGVSKAELAYRWVAHHSALTKNDALIFGASSIGQIQQTPAGIKKGPLSAEAVTGVERIWNLVKAEAPLDNYVAMRT